MPLTASDIQYLNKLLDRRLKAQRAWPLTRYFLLLAGVMLLVMGAVMWVQASGFEDFMDNILPAATHQREPSATNPVTEAQMLKLLESSEEMLKAYARFAALMASLRMGIYFLAMMQGFIGGTIIFRTIVNWNRHRRDKILITLLREKCATELAPVPPA